MYNTFKNNVYKKYQVNIGNPYQVKPKRAPLVSGTNASILRISAQEEAETILENARLEAETIIEKACSESNEMLEDAQIKIANYISELEQQAKEEGYKKGETLARQHYQDLLDEAEALKLASKEALERTVSSMEEEIVETVLEISKKIINMELSHNKEVILGLIRTALLNSSLSDEAIIHVCSDDYDYVQENKESIQSSGKNNRNIKIQKDYCLEKGECLVETGFGSVDSSIETQFDEVAQTFRDLIGNERS